MKPAFATIRFLQSLKVPDPDDLRPENLELVPAYALADHPATVERQRRVAAARTKADAAEREEERARALLARIERDRRKDRAKADVAYAEQERKRRKIAKDDPFDPGAASPPPPVYDDARPHRGARRACVGAPMATPAAAYEEAYAALLAPVAAEERRNWRQKYARHLTGTRTKIEPGPEPKEGTPAWLTRRN